MAEEYHGYNDRKEKKDRKNILNNTKVKQATKETSQTKIPSKNKQQKHLTNNSLQPDLPSMVTHTIGIID